MSLVESALPEIRYRASLMVLGLVRFLPYGFVLGMFRTLAVLACILDPFHRKTVQAQMRSALGVDRPWYHALKVFMHHADILVDTVRYAYLSDDEIRRAVKVEGREHLDEALKSARGIMMITGHIGNWEILSHIPRLLGTQFCVMADRREDPRLESIVDSIRSRSGATILPPTGKALMLIRELKKGRTIGVVVDNRGDRKDGLLCDVLGMPAPTNPAPAFLAIKGNALVLPVYAVKKQGTYHICFSQAIDAGSFGQGEQAVRQLSDAMQAWVSSVVVQYPLQWFWLYSRWLRRSDLRKVIRRDLNFREFVLGQAKDGPL